MDRTLAMRWRAGTARRLFILYLFTVLGPLAVAAAAFTLRDLLVRRRPDPSEGNGHAEAEALEYTVEEVQAI
jgi:hypothetical protein